MAENNAQLNQNQTSSSSNFTQNPPPPSIFSCKKPEEEDSDTLPGPKRRKTCPTTLDKVQELSSSNGNFSFTFDTKFVASVPQVTPKFGSFSVFPESTSTTHKDQRKQGAQQIDEAAEEQQSGVTNVNVVTVGASAKD